MRSASRLDFVAKSLALAGLGVLGLSAALLDRWNIALPPVPSPAVGRVTPAIQIAFTLPEFSTWSAAPAPVTVRREARRTPDAPAGIVAGPDTGALERLPASSEPTIDVPRELPVPIHSEPVAGTLVALAAVPAVVDTWQPMAASLAPPGDRVDEGFVAGVLKRTGSTVSVSLGKASDTVRGAARVVGDAVKRAF